MTSAASSEDMLAISGSISRFEVGVSNLTQIRAWIYKFHCAKRSECASVKWAVTVR